MASAAVAVEGRRAKRGTSSKVVMKLEAIDKDIRGTSKAHAPWIQTPQADTIFGLVILLNAVFIGIDVEWGGDDFNWWSWTVESCFLLVFLAEVILRIRAEMPRPLLFFDAWGIFDFTVTLLGIVDAWVVTLIIGTNNDSPMSSFTVLRMFRLIRLARLIRVLRMFNELVVLVQTLGNSVRAVGWMSLLLGMIIYTGSIVCVLLLGQPLRDSDPEIDKYFGSLGDALFSHFCVVTLESWPDIAMAAMQQSSLWALYFVMLITLTNFALVNLMVGVIVERIIHYSMEQETELSAFVAESEQFRQTMQTLFEHADIDHNGTVTRSEVRSLLKDKRTNEIMTAFGINLNIPASTLHTIMDLKRDGPTNFTEFFDACMRLCGSKQSIHSLFVQHDICECQQELCERLKSLENQLKAGRRLATVAGGPGATSGGAAYAAGEGARQPPASAEEGLMELLERMDRFGQVQGQIFKELQALKDQAKRAFGEQGAGGGSVDDLAGDGVLVAPTKPTELGPCCIDGLFSKRKEPRAVPGGGSVGSSPTSGHHNSGRALRAKHRKELEAEFCRKQAGGGTPATAKVR